MAAVRSRQGGDGQGHAVITGFEQTSAEVAAAMNLSPMAATSVTGNAGAQSQTVYWNLLVDVSDVDDNTG
ncbi:hypothetical protein H7H82_07445, partial [Mycobacterium heidelbergense]|nr:hypothetical protein [Mycobacterium heidelbergense]